MALFINEGQEVTGLPGQQVQDVLVVTKADIVPHHVLSQVLILLQLEDVPHKELLQLLVGKVNAQLLKTVKTRGDTYWDKCSVVIHQICRPAEKSHDLFVLKFSKPKMSSRLMDLWEDLGPLVSVL